MTCLTHHDACECREAAHREEIARKDEDVAYLKNILLEQHDIEVLGREDGTYDPPENGWVCFHCGIRFKRYHQARAHFGEDTKAPPWCVEQSRKLTAAEDKADRLDRQMVKRDAEIARLRAALGTYGRHEPGCTHPHPCWGCTCGLSEALAAGREVDRG